MSEGLTESVSRFLADHISSVEQLEILLFLYSTLEPASASECAKRFYMSEESATNRLESFVARNLVLKSDSGPEGSEPRYRINQGDSQVMRQLSEVAASYRERRVSVISYIYSNPISTIQTFAEAFVIGKKKK